MIEQGFYGHCYPQPFNHVVDFQSYVNRIFRFLLAPKLSGLNI